MRSDEAFNGRDDDSTEHGQPCQLYCQKKAHDFPPSQLILNPHSLPDPNRVIGMEVVSRSSQKLWRVKREGETQNTLSV